MDFFADLYNLYNRIFRANDQKPPVKTSTEGTATPLTEVETFVQPYKGPQAPVIEQMREGYTRVKNGAEETGVAQLTGAAQDARRKQAEGSNSGGESGRRA